MTLQEAVRYLDGRHRRVFDSERGSLKWTYKDAHALRVVLLELRSLSRRNGRLP
jgi:KaiC/GvpD/RAD55 family RecA-like ATPase